MHSEVHNGKTVAESIAVVLFSFPHTSHPTHGRIKKPRAPGPGHVKGSKQVKVYSVTSTFGALPCYCFCSRKATQVSDKAKSRTVLDPCRTHFCLKMRTCPGKRGRLVTLTYTI